MKLKKLLIPAIALTAIATAGIIYAADHIDSPAVTDTPTDITDFYVFRAQDPNNLVFIANTQGLLSPGSTGAAKFDENTLIEINIDTNDDKIEDLVIQCKYDASTNKVYVFGPAVPSQTGTRSKIEGNSTAEVVVTPYGSNPVTATGGSGIKVFAGPRDDPFFFDLNRYTMILAGNAPGFNNPGTDAFKGTNVMSIVVEVPKTLIGGSGKINTWLETKKRA